MPRPQFVPYDHTLPRAREARPVGLNLDSIFQGTREHSRTEGLARLLMSKSWERVERLRSMKRARILRERAEEETVEAAAEQRRAEEGLQPAPEPSTVPNADAINPNDRGNASSTGPGGLGDAGLIPPAVPSSHPPSAPPPSDTGAVIAGPPPASPRLAPKRVRFDPDAASGANAHPPVAVPGAFPPTSQSAAPPASPANRLQSTLSSPSTSTPHQPLPDTDPTTQLPPASEVQAQLNNADPSHHIQQVYTAAPHYGFLPAHPPQHVTPPLVGAASQVSIAERPVNRGDLANSRLVDCPCPYYPWSNEGWQWDRRPPRLVLYQHYQQHQLQMQHYRGIQQSIQQMDAMNLYTHEQYAFIAVSIPTLDLDPGAIQRVAQHQRLWADYRG